MQVISTPVERSKRIREVITIEQIKADEKLEKELLDEIKEEFLDAQDFMRDKKKDWITYEKKYTNPKVAENDLVKLHVLHQHMKAHCSNYFEADLGVEFDGTDFWFDDYAYRLQKMAERSQVLMDKHRKDFQHVRDVGFYGVSARIKMWWDEYIKEPIFDTINPKFVYMQKTTRFNDYDYTWVSTRITKARLKAINAQAENEGKPPVYYGVDAIPEGICDEITKESDMQRSLNMTVADDKEVNLIEWFKVFRGRKYQVTVSFGFKTVHRLNEIVPLTEAEKKNPLKVPFPVVYTNLFPLYADPTGMWLAELAIGGQDAKNKLMNLLIIKEEQNAGFRHILADMDLIPNSDLLKDRNQNWPVIVPARTKDGKSLSQAIHILDADKWDSNTTNMIDRLDREIQSETWYSAANRWLPFWPNQTLWEAKQQQVNSNLMFRLDAQIIGFGEEDFWRIIWLRSLLEYMSDTEKKYTNFGNWLIGAELEINREDIEKGLETKVKVISRKQALEDAKPRLAYLTAREPIVLNNPEVPKISKIMMCREIEKLNGTPREEILARYPLLPDERRAMIYKRMINSDEMPQNLFKPGIDLFTYYICFQSCKNTEVKEKVLSEIESRLTEQWMSIGNVAPWEYGNWAMGSTANASASMLQANMIKNNMSQTDNLPTRQSVVW